MPTCHASAAYLARPASFMILPKLLVGLVDEGRSFGAGHPRHPEPAVLHEVLEFLALMRLLDRSDHLVANVRRNIGRSEHAAPGEDRPVGARRLLDGRHVRVEPQALAVHLRQCARLAGIDQCATLGQRRGDEVDAAGDEVLHGGTGTLVRHPRDLLGVDLLGQQPADKAEMPDAALAGA